MRKTLMKICLFPRSVACSVLVAAIGLALSAGVTQAQKLDPLVYTIRFPQPATKTFTVDIQVPTGKRDSVDMMMAIWSPGFYGIQNYADRVSAFTATAPD